MTTSTKIIVGLVTAIILSGGSIAFLLLNQLKTVPEEQPQVTTTEDVEGSGEDKYNFGIDKPLSPNITPQGTIALSIMPVGSTLDRPYLHLFNLQTDSSISDSETPRVLFSVGSQFDSATSFYAATESDESLSNRNDHYQIHFIDLASDTAVPVQVGEGENERYLDWNDQRQLLVYSRQVSGSQHVYEDMIDYKNSELVILDVKNKTETVVGNGGYGKWSPDGKSLLYMARDGLHMYEIDSKRDRLVVNARQIHNSAITAVTMMDLSPDGNYLIWTTPHLRLLSLFKVTSWEPFAIEEVGRMSDSVEYYWPQFSPDSQFYVLQAKDTTPGTSPQTRLEIRQVESRDVVKSFSLEGFDFNKAFIDDWIQ